MGLFNINTGYDKDLNPKDCLGHSYDRSTGSYLGEVDRNKHSNGGNLLGKLILICFVIYIMPGFVTDLAYRHPGIKIFFLIVFCFWIVRKIKRIFK
ncbi:MAG TPA: hypothetical protein VFI29_06425 [Hanamia sp.]|nr:hypothetical protein [Hanamia sp.]